MKNLSSFKSGILFWLGILLTTFVWIWAYAAYSTLSVNINDSLSASKWNELVSYTIPPGAVVAFYGTNCPANWSPADGTANGVKKTDGTPGTLDLRGEFIRGLDNLRGVDPSRTLWSGQNGSLLITEVVNNGGVGMITRQDSQAYSDAWPGTGLSAAWISGTIWTYANPYIRTVRPRNVALLYCVKN